jgi:hypothetical protein
VTREEGCPLCVHQPPEVVIATTDSCLAVWNEHEPPEGGAALIIPMAHRDTVFSLTDREWLDTRILLEAVRGRIDERVSPDGFNVGWNVGTVGGQGIPSRSTAYRAPVVRRTVRRARPPVVDQVPRESKAEVAPCGGTS